MFPISKQYVLSFYLRVRCSGPGNGGACCRKTTRRRSCISALASQAGGGRWQRWRWFCISRRSRGIGGL
jgi:hypothetical protein